MTPLNVRSLRNKSFKFATREFMWMRLQLKGMIANGMGVET